MCHVDLPMYGRTHYALYGNPKADVTIVMVHGFRGDHHGLEALAGYLNSNFCVIIPDLPGYGSSASFIDMKHTVKNYAKWLNVFCHSFDFSGKCVLVGHSFGSLIVACALSQGNTFLVRAVKDAIFINPIAEHALKGPRTFLTRLAVLYYRLGANLPERLGFAFLRNRAVVWFMSKTMIKTQDRAMRAWIHDQHKRYFSSFSDRDVVLESFRASVSHTVGEYAPHISSRVLLIAGKQDDISPVSTVAEVKTRFSNASFECLDRVGHLIHYEKPNEAAVLIEDFLL